MLRGGMGQGRVVLVWASACWCRSRESVVENGQVAASFRALSFFVPFSFPSTDGKEGHGKHSERMSLLALARAERF